MKKIVVMALMAPAMFLTAEARGLMTRADATPHVYAYAYQGAIDDWEFMPGNFTVTPELMQIDEDPLIYYTGLQSYDGWYHDGLISGIVTGMHTGSIAWYYQYTYDFEKNEMKFFKEFYKYVENYYVPYCETELYLFQSKLNPRDGKVYGYGYNLADSGNIYWISGDFETIDRSAKTIKLANDDVCYAMTYNEAEGSFFGVNRNQQFVKIDNDGTQTVIFTMPSELNLSTATAGLVWSPVDSRYYFSPLDKNGESFIYTFTPDGKVELYTFVEGQEVFTFMFCTDKVKADEDGVGSVGIGSGVSIAGGNGSVRISGAEGASYVIYTPDGSKIGAGIADSDTADIAVAPGLYVVKVGDSSSKVVVR